MNEKIRTLREKRAAALTQARALLDGSDVSIAYIAEACGFENLYHFSRAFRAYEGISPSEYRRRRAVSPAEDRTP